MSGLFAFIFVLAIPGGLTIWNIVAFFRYMQEKREGRFDKFIEIAAILIGVIFTYLYLSIVRNMTFNDWNVQLINNQVHTMIATEHYITIACFLEVSFIGYLFVRIVPAAAQSPILSAVGIAAMYIGIIDLVVWCIQTLPDLVLAVVPCNIILIFVKTIAKLVYEKNQLIQTEQVSLKASKLTVLLNDATQLPRVAFIVMIPLLGILVALLFLLGQEPNAMIKAWTETADWTFSTKTPPPNVEYDEHYLCTVAAGGHQQVVKPLRTGNRHGHTVVVNRQLCIANAFEQIIEERTPKFHRVVRGVYDKTGYPFAKHIKNKGQADAIYFLMKPLEWIFLLIIYTVDVHPEDRIAVQYPHKKLSYK